MILFPHSESSEALRCIQDRISLLMEQKIKQNIIDDKHYAPWISKSLIYAYSICEPENSTNSVHEFLMTALKCHYLKFYKLYPSQALKILPENVIIDGHLLVCENKCYRGTLLRSSLRLTDYNESLVCSD